ncbi:MAG: molybdopterin molybdotransferase MoeA [Halanaerobiales bacterium]|nr:molybdopterin molybdotransferase MoeA [Halanaerobiales bacterium]
MKDLTKLSRLEGVIKLICQRPERMLSEEIGINEAFGRIVGHELYASENLLHFSSSMQDGFAVSAMDTFGASNENPITLKIVGEIKRGKNVHIQLESGKAVKVVAGGMLPFGADVVISNLEANLIGESSFEVNRPFSPGENLIPIGSDYRSGDLILSKGHQLRSQDVGILAALGFDYLYVTQKPNVALVSIGCDLLPITEDLRPGCMRDLNAYSLSSLVKCNKGVPVLGGIIEGGPIKMKETVKRLVEENDFLLISSGTINGCRDSLVEIFSQMGEIVCDGIAVNPGMTTFIAEVDKKLVFVLPGHPISAMIIFELLVKQYLDMVTNCREKLVSYLPAKISCDISSRSGWDEYFAVKFEIRDGEYWASPIPNRSVLISTLVKADGLIHIPWDSNGLHSGELVKVQHICGNHF